MGLPQIIVDLLTLLSTWRFRLPSARGCWLESHSGRKAACEQSLRRLQTGLHRSVLVS
jgi:hypothetical protein